MKFNSILLLLLLALSTQVCAAKRTQLHPHLCRRPRLCGHLRPDDGRRTQHQAQIHPDAGTGPTGKAGCTVHGRVRSDSDLHRIPHQHPVRNDLSARTIPQRLRCPFPLCNARTATTTKPRWVRCLRNPAGTIPPPCSAKARALWDVSIRRRVRRHRRIARRTRRQWQRPWFLLGSEEKTPFPPDNPKRIHSLRRDSVAFVNEHAGKQPFFMMINSLRSPYPAHGNEGGI